MYRHEGRNQVISIQNSGDKLILYLFLIKVKLIKGDFHTIRLPSGASSLRIWKSGIWYTTYRLAGDQRGHEPDEDQVGAAEDILLYGPKFLSHE